MKANELRIGNWVVNDADILPLGLVQIASIDENNVEFKNVSFVVSPITNIKPIPITEEWLKKFGFETVVISEYDTNNSDGKIYGLSDFLISKYQDKFHYTYYGSDEMGRYGNGQYDKMFTAIQYVHQLQNLYFALTGKELTH